MKVIKPQRLGLLARTFEHAGTQHFTVSGLVFFDLAAQGASALLPEVALWRFLPEQLGRDAALDAGMPKSRAEVLLTARAYPPGGEPRAACAVRVQLGAVDKTLHVVGNRSWRHGAPTLPEPFTELPITWERAYGGPGHAPNPLGRGHAPVRTSTGEAHALPNVEDPRHPVRSLRDRPAPAGFGALDQTWPQRATRAGTYDERWVREHAPGFPPDIDWTFFNTAPQDQHLPAFLRGDEPFTLTHLHPTRPLLPGRLPGVAVRAFVTLKTPEGEAFREVGMRLDTVHLFPHAERGVLVFRGVTQVREDDGADVVHLLGACEALDAPRPAAHYQDVLRQRLDKERGHLAALRDQDLMPQGTPAGFTLDPGSEAQAPPPQDLLGKRLRHGAELQLQRLREDLRARGLDPDVHVPAALPPEPPPPTLDALDTLVAQAEQLSGDAPLDAEARHRAHAQQLREACAAQGVDYDAHVARQKELGGGPPTFHARTEHARLTRTAAQARQHGAPNAALEARLAEPALMRKLELAEAALLDAYRSGAHLQPPAARLAPARAAAVRERVRAEVAASGSLERWDLTGADLSELDLRGARLDGALLEHADLRGTVLSGASLEGAVLAHADLSDADLRGARLVGANLGGARLARVRASEGTDLTGAVLTRADLRDANLSGALLDRADLGEAVLAGADLRRVRARELTLLRTDLSGARLEGADLSKGSFLELSLAGADLAGADLTGAVLLSCNAEGAVLRGARLDNLRVVKESSLAGAALGDASLRGANLRGTRLAGADLSRAALHGADLSECDLQGARLTHAQAPDARFVRANLDGASLVGCNLVQAVLQKARLHGTDVRGANLFRADLLRSGGDVRGMQEAYLRQVRVGRRGTTHG